MASKMSPSMVGECERVSDSVQPVHSWKESQITEGRFACSSAAATARDMVGGRASSDVVAAQNLRKLRREIPRALRKSSKLSSAIVFPCVDQVLLQQPCPEGVQSRADVIRRREQDLGAPGHLDELGHDLF